MLCIQGRCGGGGLSEGAESGYMCEMLVKLQICYMVSFIRLNSVFVCLSCITSANYLEVYGECYFMHEYFRFHLLDMAAIRPKSSTDLIFVR